MQGKQRRENCIVQSPELNTGLTYGITDGRVESPTRTVSYPKRHDMCFWRGRLNLEGERDFNAAVIVTAANE